MGRTHYTREQKAEAVALALVVGSPEAAKQLGIGDPATVRNWVRASGHPADIAVPSDDMRALYTLALARTNAAVAAGKMSPVAMATVAGIAKRNLDRPVAPVEKRSPVEAEADKLEADLVKRYGDLADVALMVVIDDGDPAGEVLETYMERRRERHHAELVEQEAHNEVRAVLARAAAFLEATA